MQKLRYGLPLKVTHNELYSAPIHRFSSISEITWTEFTSRPNKAVHISVQLNGDDLPLEALFIPRKHPDLLVGLHGGLEKRELGQPYFQHVWSFKSRPESLLFLFDSTLYIENSLYSSYYLGTPDQDLVTQYASLINSLREATAVDHTFLCGHSSGGTGALKIGSRVPHSRTIAGNPMLADEEFVPRHLELTRVQAFPNTESAEDFYDQYSDRIWVTPWLETRVEDSTFTWFVHKNDVSMVTNHAAKRAAAALGLSDQTGGNTSAGDAFAVCDWDYPTSSHMLPFLTESKRHSFLPFIEAVRGEDSDFDPKILAGTDPAWPESSAM